MFDLVGGETYLGYTFDPFRVGKYIRRLVL